VETSIIGLPKSGKTTVFNALTKGKAETATYTHKALTPNIGISKVPDSRLISLESIFHPKKVTQAEIKYIDIVGTGKSYGKGEGIGGQFLNYLSDADALLQVVRGFNDENIPHVEKDIDPIRDVSITDMELVFSDLTIIERKLERFEIELKGAKSTERELFLKEQTLLKRIRAELGKNLPIWRQHLTDEEARSLSNYQFLTAKPMLVIINIGENQLAEAASLELRLSSQCSYPQFEVVALSGKLEMELAQLSEIEAEEFRKALGLAEPATDRVIKASYRLLGLISFFTTVSSELRAWTIPKGTTALKASSKIHSDIASGFIRAEVVKFNDLIQCRSLVEAKKSGVLRLEGKNYIVQDGDVITFLFNV
jgi:GTP-binding protein YchF